ncbi:MAG TPA: hypothetical protein V6C78_16000 [Crinalium sp.]|jgi:hypothetical protein
MANYWAIAIGINQYRCFQPLLYAQRDAQTLWNYWLNEGGFTQDHCLLLTDVAAITEENPAYPSRDNIENAIAHFCQQLHPDDFLWCFFSGYGVRFQGQDYLMPVEGDPSQAPATGVPLESIFAHFQSAATKNILLILDINRSQGVLDAEGVGKDAVTLAHQHGVSTILSCGPDQFSHETLALRQGLFTTALIEGLRFYGCTTLAQLSQYLSKRLPELSEHHWRPRQDPIVIVPADQQYHFIVPARAIATVGTQPTLELVKPSVSSSTSSAYPDESLVPTIQPPIETVKNGFHPTANGYPLNGTNGTAQAATQMPPASNGHMSNGKTIPQQPSTDQPSPDSTKPAASDDLFWRRTLPWIVGFVSLLVLAVIIQNRGAFDASSSDSTPPASNAAPKPGAGSNNATSSTINPTAQVFTAPSSSSSSSTAPANAISTPNAESTSPNANLGTSPILVPQTATAPVTGNPTGTAAPSNAGNTSAGAIATSGQSFPSVRAALQAQDYSNAIHLLEQIPPQQRTGDYTALLRQADQGILTQARVSLSRPRALTPMNQASDFNTAIQLANQIKPDHPLYAEAQQSIDRWGQMILDLARSRASQPNRGSSLIAAQNYKAAIGAASLVPVNHSKRTVAQQFVSQWSQTILQLARSRATEGRLDVAIQTAEQIPQNAPAYRAAQQAIAQWRSQLSYTYY